LVAGDGRGILEPGAPVAADLWCLKGIFQGRLIRGWRMKIVVLLLVCGAVIYLATCSGLSASKSHAFEVIKHGDSREAVVDALGVPDVRELPGKLFARYASKPCEGSCKERLWFENKLSLGIEAWSVELDQDDHVIDKAHWHSP
ncbi:hypothetical protein ABQG29_20650, partial [Xanthomonas nasturtii]